MGAKRLRDLRLQIGVVQKSLRLQRFHRQVGAHSIDDQQDVKKNIDNEISREQNARLAVGSGRFFEGRE